MTDEDNYDDYCNECNTKLRWDPAYPACYCEEETWCYACQRFAPCQHDVAIKAHEDQLQEMMMQTGVGLKIASEINTCTKILLNRLDAWMPADDLNPETRSLLSATLKALRVIHAECHSFTSNTERTMAEIKLGRDELDKLKHDRAIMSDYTNQN